MLPSSGGDQRVLHAAGRSVLAAIQRELFLEPPLLPSATHLTRREIREGHLEGGTPELHDHGNSNGLGDLTLLGQYRVIQAAGRSLAFLGGLKVPSGETDVSGADGERFEVEHQPGTGSWDPLVGAATTVTVPFGSLDANLLATIATEGAEETNLGHLINLNLALSRRALGREHVHAEGAAEHGHSSLDLVAELNGEWRARQRVAGSEDREQRRHTGVLRSRGSSGGRRRVERGRVSRRPRAELHGRQHETDLRVVVGMGILF
jgi:hypothetical protein